MVRLSAVVILAIALLVAAVLAIRGWVLPNLGDDAADVGLIAATAVITAAVTSAVWAFPVVRRAVGRHRRKSKGQDPVAALRRHLGR